MNESLDYRNHLACLLAVVVTFAAVGIDAASPSADPSEKMSEREKHRHTYGPPRLHRPGHRVRRLPDGYHRLRHRRHDYYYHHGVFYRPHRSSGYITVNAPFGARVRHLPPGHVDFRWRDRHYFYVNMTYFLWDRNDREYVVVKAPSGAVNTMVSASNAGSSEVFVYPNQGQSEQQRDRDRYECYLWSVDESGYDPAGRSQDFTRAGNYRRALTACLEGRGYSVK